MHWQMLHFFLNKLPLPPLPAEDNVLLQQQMDVIKGGPSSVAMMMHSTGAEKDKEKEGGAFGDKAGGGRGKSSHGRHHHHHKRHPAGAVDSTVYRLAMEQRRHIRIADKRLYKIAQDRLTAMATGTGIARSSQPKSTGAAASASGASGGAAAAMKKALASAGEEVDDDALFSTSQHLDGTLTAKRKVHLLNTRNYKLR